MRSQRRETPHPARKGTKEPRMFKVFQTYASATDSVWLCAAVAMHGTWGTLTTGDRAGVRMPALFTVKGPQA